MVIHEAVVHLGTRALRGGFEQLADAAQSSMHADVFRLDDPAFAASLGALRSRGVGVSLLADTDVAVGRDADRLREVVAAWHELGSDPLKQHGKSATIDGGRAALVGTDLADKDAAHRFELGVSFSGDHARALAAIHAESSGLDPDALARVLAEGNELGIVANDPRVEAMFATRAMESLVDDHGGSLLLMSKAVDDEAFVDRIARALHKQEAPGAALLTHDIPKSQTKTLRKAGMTVHEFDEKDAAKRGAELHGTLISTNNGAFIGSPYLESRVLHGSDGRMSRELGVVLGGDAAAQAEAAWHHMLRAVEG